MLQSDIIHVYVGLINYALKHKHRYPQWKQTVACMIKKSSNSNLVHKLRCISLYEFDLSILMGIKFKQTLHYANRLGALHEMQLGSTPGRRVLSCV